MHSLTVPHEPASAPGGAFAAGAGASLRNFYVDRGEIGDVGLAAFCSHIIHAPASVLQNLYELWLSNNQIGDEGAVALFDALGDGALANLGDLRLQFNQVGDAGLDRLSVALGKGALSKTWYLGLSDNAFTDVGLGALEVCVEAGGMPRLEFLTASSAKATLAAQKRLQDAASGAMAARAKRGPGPRGRS